MKIAIVDDELEMRTQLSGYVDRFGTENSVSLETVLFPSGDRLLEGYTPAYDIIIFDIDMPGTNGMDTARLVRAQDENVVILFVTNIAQYAINGYEVEAVDYIIKPIGYYDFSMKFQRALRRVRQREKEQMVIDSTDGPVRLSAEDILYVEVLAHYLIYHTREKEISVRGSMKEHEASLRERGFCRAHKSYLVGLRHIENIRSSEVIVDGKSLPLGRTYKDALMQEYLRYLRG